MTKEELIKAVAGQFSTLLQRKAVLLNRGDVDAAVDVFLKTIMVAVGKGEKVKIKGFGTFELKDMKARWGINLRTMSPIRIPERKLLAFRPSRQFRDLIKKSNPGRMLLSIDPPDGVDFQTAKETKAGKQSD
jgi:nucleoid DNA-binding protein